MCLLLLMPTVSCTIVLISIFVSTAALLCKHVIVNKYMHVNLHLHNTSEYKHWLLIGTSMKFFDLTKHAVKKAKLMLYKPLFIVHVLKGLLKSYTVVQKWSTSVTKVGMAHAYWSFIKMLRTYISSFSAGKWGVTVQ